jgi:eukaryotic-like serine/threonine-protein kinase
MNDVKIDEEVIYHVARGIKEAAARDAYLQHVCMEDKPLRDRLDALLRVCDLEGSFLELPVFDAKVEVPGPIERAGTMIGPYKLIEQIGEGGMGVVFLAEQSQPVRRKVALKVIKPGMDSRQVIARFEAERQALALMDHPNISRIIDGGVTESGRPYFVMELVKGLPITEYCNRNRLTVRKRLELFVPVCQAVQHAHQKGIIHRDLKPSNVLVTMHDAQPVVKVIDFGVSKALGQDLTDKTLCTGFAQMVGTPLYMSPEQAGQSALDTDTRSDIYTLGVLLYELLTGTTPFDKERFRKAAYDEIRRIVREEEPPKPSTRLSEARETLSSTSALRDMEPVKLRKLVRGELDWIVMKCLEKDRNRRYESASGFAADVQRYLNNEPVLACPPSFGYRLSKFANRNKGPVLAGLALTALLLLGIVGTSIGLAWALRAEGTAKRAAASESNQRKRAEAAYEAEVKQRRMARKAVDEMYTQVAQKWLSQQPRMEKVQREFLEKSLSYYREFAREQSTDPAAQLEQAAAYRRMGVMDQMLGRHAEAEEAHGRAIAISGKLAAGFPSVRDYRKELAENHYQLGYLQMYTNRLEEAEKSFRESLRIHEQLVVDFGEDDDLRRDLAADHHSLGMTQSGGMGGVARPKEARDAYRRALEYHKRLVAGATDVAENQSSLAATQNDLCMLLLEGGELAEARLLVEEAISHQRAALKIDPRRPTYRLFLCNHLVNLGRIEETEGNHESAVKTAREAMALQEKLADDFPEVPHYRHGQAELCYHLGKLLEDDDRREAEAILRQAVSLLETMVDSFAKVPERRGLLADCHEELGLLLDADERRTEAVAAYRAALRWEPKSASTLTALGRNMLKQRMFALAEPPLREAWQIRKEKLPDDWMTFDTESMLGGALLGRKKYAEAEPRLLAGYDGMMQRESRIPEEGKVRLTEALERLVKLYEATGNEDESAKWRKRLESRMEAQKTQKSAPKP